MADTQEKRPEDLNKPEAGSQETTNPFLDQIAREAKSEPLPQKTQDTAKTSPEHPDLPSFEITNEKAKTGKNADNTKSGDAASESGRAQDKLESTKYGPDKVLEAFAAAKERNVPVIVNRNMDSCAPSQMSNMSLDKFIKSNGGLDKAPAVVVDLNMDKLNSKGKELAGMPDGPQKDALGDELKLAFKLMNAGHGIFPELSKYDANDTSKPQANVIGADSQNISRLLNKTDKPSESSESKTESSSELKFNPEKDKILKFSDKDMVKAVEYAKEHNLPLIVFTGGDFCAPSKEASHKIDYLADSMARSADPHAVIVKLDVSQQLPINRNPAAGT
ncbi:MAG: hypothetical protein K2X81_08945, partial [Candidatus Obscuribacterales bacterium]|nr:hypothetical protein [Candidatus Obscuribacterales bacterium]